MLICEFYIFFYIQCNTFDVYPEHIISTWFLYEILLRTNIWKRSSKNKVFSFFDNVWIRMKGETIVFIVFAYEKDIDKQRHQSTLKHVRVHLTGSKAHVYLRQFISPSDSFSLKCHYDQILDTHFFTFSNTKGLS